MEKILITGGDGFIGSHLTQELIKKGANLTLIIKPNANLWRIKDLLSKVKIIEVDITDYISLYKAVSKIKPNKILHLAALVDTDQKFEKSELLFKINTLGTINLLRALDNINYDCFVYVSTCEEYGDGPTPFKETQSVAPISPYSASKAAAVFFCSMYHKIQGKPVVILRLFPTYGPKQEFNSFIPKVIKSAIEKRDFKMTKGEQYREFIYVADVVNALINAMKKPKAIGEIINLGIGVEYQIKEVAEKIVKIMGNPINVLSGAIPYRKKEIWHLYCDNTKAKKILGWRSRVDLDKGLEKTIKWYQKNINQLIKI